MLSPEVWNFKSPQHHFSLSRRDYKKKDIPALVETHYFNHSVSIVLPDTTVIPDEVWNCLSQDSDYYRINALNVYDIVNPEFIEAFVKKGELTLLTIGNKIDVDNSISVTPTGNLIISLVIEDYQTLGLEGKASFFDRKVHTRYVVTIDLKNENFIPGKKNYERTRIALEERLKENFDVIVAWHPSEINICPSSIAAWFHTRSYHVSLCRQTFYQRIDYSLAIPTLQDGCDMNKFFEWLGVFSIGCDLFNGNRGDDVNIYECPSPFIHIGQVKYLQWTGFFTHTQIGELYNILKEYVLLRDTLPWISLHVQGFADSSTNWDLKEHTFFTDGDNSYTIIFPPKNNIIMRKSLSCNNKL